MSNLTCPDERSVYLEWSRPEVYYHSVDAYRVFYRRRDASDSGADVGNDGGSEIGGAWAVQERRSINDKS